MVQIIPPGKEACFEIVYSPNIKGTFNNTISYYINDCHPFGFLVNAVSEPVALDLSRKAIKFQFSDDNTNMYLTEEVILSNYGNADAEFKWNYREAGLFRPEPSEGVVKKGSSMPVHVVFTPNGPKGE